MPGRYDRPGLYVEEGAGSVTVTPPVTDVGAIIGESLRGRTDRARRVTSWSEFVRHFGDMAALPAAHLHGTLAVYNHFANRGGPLWFGRVTGAGAAGASALDRKSLKRLAGAGDDAVDVYASSKGSWGNLLSISTKKWSTACVLAEIAPGGAGVADTIVDIESLAGVEVGDIVNVYTPAGVFDGAGVIGAIITNPLDYAARNLLAGRNYILLADGSRIGAPGPVAAGSALQSASKHRGSARLLADYATTTTTVSVVSTAGISVGSFVSVLLVAICNDDNTRDKKLEGHARVQAISGTTLTLAAKLRNLADSGDAGDIVRQVKSFAKSTWTNAGNTEGFTLAAVKDGSDGNSVSYEVILGAVLGVVVTGNHIAVTVNNGVTLANAVAAAIAANPAAASLVTAAAVTDGAGGDAVVDSAVAKRFLTGGAYARVVSQEFDVVVREAGKIVEVHEYLSCSPTSADDVNVRLGGTSSAPNDNNQSSRLILLRDADLTATPNKLEAWPRCILEDTLTAGVEGATPSDVEAVGVSTQGSETGIFLLEANEEIAFAAMPGFTSPYVASSGVAWAERNGSVWVQDTPQSAVTRDLMLQYAQVDLGIESSYGALYGPWLKLTDPRDSTKIVDTPPASFVLAEYSKAARLGGAHVPPANLGALKGVVDVSVKLTPADLDILHRAKINIIKPVPGAGIRVYGVRTLAGQGDPRKFVNVRRFLNYFRKALISSYGSLVLQAANVALMRTIVFVTTKFAEQEWRRGALYPDTDFRAAFSMKCDEETTTAADLANGTIYAEIRMSPVTPAEHIVFGIGLSAGGIRLTEQV